MGVLALIAEFENDSEDTAGSKAGPDETKAKARSSCG